jgi:hypothetical protein
MAKPDSTPEPDVEPQWDRLLRKYVAVWLWSILFGTTTGVIFFFMNYRPSGDWREISLIYAYLVAIGGLTAILGWFVLLRYLTDWLLPDILGPAIIPSRRLKLAVQLLIIAVFVGLMLSMSQLILQALGRIR